MPTNTRLFFDFLIKQYSRFIYNPKIVGVFGKPCDITTIRSCKAVLEQKFKKVAIGSSGAFKTFLQMLSNTDKIILAMDPRSTKGVEPFLRGLKPQTVVAARVYQQALDGLKNTEDILLENVGIIEATPEKGLMILNWDDSLLRKLSEKTKAQVLFYGTDQHTCQIWAGKTRIVNFRTSFELNYGVERVEINSNLLGFHQIYSLLAAAALGVSFDIPLLTIKKGLENVAVFEHKMQVCDGVNGSFVIDDTDNDLSLDTEEAIECLNQISARRRIVVLGKAIGSEGSSEKLFLQIAQKIYKDKIDLVFLKGENVQIIADELNKLGFIKERLQYNLTNPQIVSKLLKIMAKGDVILIKGDRSVKLDEVVKRITKHKRF